MTRQSKAQSSCQVQNIFKSKDKKEVSQLVTLKMARLICSAHSNDSIKLTIRDK